MAAGLLGAVVALLHMTDNPVLERVEGITLDWRFVLRGPLPSPTDTAIITIDDRSLAGLGRWPLPRATLARAIDQLSAAGAKTIAVDILLIEQENASNQDGEIALAAALRRHGQSILAMAMLFNESAPPPDLATVATLSLPAVARPATGALHPPEANGLLQPLPMLQAAARPGHVNLLPDTGGTPRAHLPVIDLAGSLLPSFPLLAAAKQRDLPVDALALSLAGELRLPVSPDGPRQTITLGRALDIPLNYLGPTGTIASYSLIDLLEDKIPPDALRGRVVLLGGTATGLGDDFITPFAATLPGVEVLATAITNLLNDNYLRRSPGQIALEAAFIVLLTTLAWCLGQAPGPRLGLGLNLALMVVWMLLAYIMLVWPLRWLAVAAPCLGIGLGATVAIAGRMVRERRMRGEVERQRGNLARYVPPTLADALADRESAAFDGREQMAAILFVDLQGFTTASEDRSPSETAHFLKEFHAQLETVVVEHQGIIAQFLGDGAFILWGLPLPEAEDPARAVACARAMLHRLHAWQPGMTARVGVHFGPVAMAQLGGQNQLQLTAAGDTVNVASRLETIAKEIGAILTVSDDVASALRALGRHDLLAGLTAQPSRRVRGRDQLLGYWSAKNVSELA
jgi:adenylate cyclase